MFHTQKNRNFVLPVILALIIFSGCGTTTQKFATEQLLISDAVDQAIDQIDFSYLTDSDVFLETRYLRSVKGSGYANTDYIISALREQLAAAGCRIHDSNNEAKIIVEPRIGALGTDGHEVTYGIPQTGQITSAAAAFSNSPVVPALPEIAFGKSDKQLGIAKITLFAYDKESKMAVWQSGLKKSESTCTNTWVMGAGPFQKGSIYEGYRFAGRDIRKNRLRQIQHADADAMVAHEADLIPEADTEDLSTVEKVTAEEVVEEDLSTN